MKVGNNNVLFIIINTYLPIILFMHFTLISRYIFTYNELLYSPAIICYDMLNLHNHISA